MFTTHRYSAESRQCKHPPTQLDLALIIEEDVGTLEGKEGEIKQQNVSLHTISILFTHSLIFN